MRVLSVSALIDSVTGGGTAERTLQLARAMSRAGIEVTVLATDAGLASWHGAPDVGGARLELVPCLNQRFMVPRLRSSMLERLVGRVDVVHLCNHWTVLNLLVQRAARRQGRPYVVCPAGGLPIFGRSKWLKRAYNALGGRSLVAGASAWVAITRRETEDFRPYGIDPAAIDVIPNGIEPREYRDGDAAGFRERFGLGDRKLVLFVGRLNAIKGPDLLLEAFASEARALSHTLVYAGPDGGLRHTLEQSARGAGLGERVRFVGWLGGSDKVAAYRAADLVVIPSRQEAMSLVALEAGACGRPVLMTDRCGFDAALDAGGAVAVPPEPTRLAQALRELLLGGRLDERGARLHELVMREYVWDVAVRRYAEVFRRVSAVSA